MDANTKLKNCMRQKFIAKRNELDISQEAMAEKLDISTRAYQKLEYGECFCSAETLIYFVNNCNIDKDVLFNDLADAVKDVKED